MKFGFLDSLGNRNIKKSKNPNFTPAPPPKYWISGFCRNCARPSPNLDKEDRLCNDPLALTMSFS